MSTIKDSIAAIATAQGYDGPAPQTIKDGILNLADTLAGDDAGDASTIADAIDVIAPYIGSGGGTHPAVVPAKDVNLYDYDGTRLYSYTAAEFANLSQLPTDVPAHNLLDDGHWNWSLEDAKAAVAKTGHLPIGLARMPKDHKTHLFVTVDSDSLTIDMYINISSGTAHIDWGDGTEMSNPTSAAQKSSHTYATAGSYEIVVDATTATDCRFGRIVNEDGLNQGYSIVGTKYDDDYGQFDSSTANLVHVLKEAYLGDNCVLGSYAYYACHSLAKLTLPRSDRGSGTMIHLAALNLFARSLSENSVIVPDSPVVVIPSGFVTISADCPIHAIASKSLTELGTYHSGEYPYWSIAGVALNDGSSVVVPSGVTGYIDASMLLPQVTDVHVLATTPPAISGFYPYDVTFHVPSSALATYRESENWSDLTLVGE